ncbi:MAG: hypothetical protein ACLP4V_13315 [Methylocella sp.]
MDISLQVPRELNGLPRPGREAFDSFAAAGASFIGISSDTI